MSRHALLLLLVLSSILAGCGETEHKPDDVPICEAHLEICDTVDNNCDGQVDEGCDCVNGTQQACYSGPEGTRDVGVCLAGSQTCVDGSWTACTEEITPGVETCDTIDNDCDGQIDEGCDCVNGAQQACYSGPEGTRDVGVCLAGSQTCVEGAWTACLEEVTPTAETCNGADDDCDGVTDPGCACINGTQQSCYAGPPGTAGVGQCKAGVRHCAAGQWGTCVGEVRPSDGEFCDGLDNTCDGLVDELPLSPMSAVTPASMTGFNLDVIGEATPISANTTGVLDGSDYVLYVTSTFGTSTGLPQSGQVVSGARTWQLAPFAQNNALKLSPGQSSTLELSPPVAASSVNLLGFSTEGSSTVSVVLHTDAGPLPAKTFTLRDWFNSAGAVLSGFDRVGRTTQEYNGSTIQPYLHSLFLGVGCSQPLPMITKIAITNTSNIVPGGGTKVVIFAASVGQ